MGLDMYAWTTGEEPHAPVDFTVELPSLLHTWRKHPDLHGWMEDLYYEKGGSQCFNCVAVQLTAADLDALESAVRNRTLPDTSGFFFGDSDGSEIEDDLAFIAKARAAIREGETVYYDSWW